MSPERAIGIGILIVVFIILVIFAQRLI